MPNIQNVKTGKVEIPAEDFEPKNYKVRITIMVDGDILDSYKKMAEEQHTKYQTLMNQKLREGMSQTHSVDHDLLKELLRRVTVLEDEIRPHRTRKEVKARSREPRAKYVPLHKSPRTHIAK